MDPLTKDEIYEERRNICNFIKQRRKEKKLSQAQLADIIGISDQTMSKIEAGKWVSLEILIKLSKPLDFKVIQ